MITKCLLNHYSTNLQTIESLSSESDESSFDEHGTYMDSNKPLVRNQCLGIASKLSYTSIVKKPLNIRK